MNKVSDDSIFIGIDFGSKYIRVAVYYDSKLKIIENSRKWRATPTTLVFNIDSNIIDDERFDYWEPNEATADCAYRFQDHKRIYAATRNSFKDQDRDNYPHNIISDRFFDRMHYEIISLRNESWPIEANIVSKRFFQRIYEDVNRMFKKNTDYKTLISVPVACTEHLKKMIVCEAYAAKLSPVETMTATDACILNYFFQKEWCKYIYDRFRNVMTILVFDMGATSLNLAIYNMSSPLNIRRRGVRGDLFLGGFDFDTVLVNHFSKMLLQLKLLTQKDLEKKSFKRLLRKECERVKMSLSSFQLDENSSSTVFQIMLKNVSFKKKITSTEFEELTAHLCRRAMNHVDQLLEQTGLERDFIGTVILSGGSTSIPQIQKLLITKFGADKVTACSVLFPRDENVVQGVALRAAMMSQNPSQVGAPMSKVFILDYDQYKNLF